MHARCVHACVNDHVLLMLILRALLTASKLHEQYEKYMYRRANELQMSSMLFPTQEDVKIEALGLAQEYLHDAAARAKGQTKEELREWLLEAMHGTTV